MTDTTKLIISGCIIFPLFFISIWIFISSYLSIDEIEKHLKDSKIILNHQGIFRNLGLLGISIRSFSIVIYILFTNLFEKKGLISRQDIRNIPTKLKLKILIPWTFGCLWFLGLIIFWIFII